MDEKEKNGIAEKRKGMRGPENVWGSGAPAAIWCILLSLFQINFYYKNHTLMNNIELSFICTIYSLDIDNFIFL